jgi:hypothetical protein
MAKSFAETGLLWSMPRLLASDASAAVVVDPAEDVVVWVVVVGVVVTVVDMVGDMALVVEASIVGIVRVQETHRRCGLITECLY